MIFCSPVSSSHNSISHVFNHLADITWIMIGSFSLALYWLIILTGKQQLDRIEVLIDFVFFTWLCKYTATSQYWHMYFQNIRICSLQCASRNCKKMRSVCFEEVEVNAGLSKRIQIIDFSIAFSWLASIFAHIWNSRHASNYSIHNTTEIKNDWSSNETHSRCTMICCWLNPVAFIIRCLNTNQIAFKQDYITPIHLIQFNIPTWWTAVCVPWKSKASGDFNIDRHGYSDTCVLNAWVRVCHECLLMTVSPAAIQPQYFYQLHRVLMCYSIDFDDLSHFCTLSWH